MIRIEGLSAQAGAFALSDITLEVPAGGYALVIGPTGSGKTTLLEAIAGHIPLTAGRISINGVEVTNLPPERRGLGIVYQQYHLFPHLSVEENIAYGLCRVAGGRGGGQADSRRAPAPMRPRVAQIAEKLGITHLLDRRVRGLSGGEQQRIAIARALAPEPSVLLLDEPFAAVDPSLRRHLRRELRELHQAEGITILQVTHDFDDAFRLGHLVAVLSQGRVVQQGTPEDVFRQPNSEVVARFLGTANVIAGDVRRIGDANEDGTFEARFESGLLVLDVLATRTGSAHAVIRPEDLFLSLEPLPPSVRNRIRGRVTRIETVGPVAQVELDAGRTLVAALTATTVDALALSPGTAVWIGLKARAVHLV